MISLSDNRRRITLPKDEPLRVPYQLVRLGKGRFQVSRIEPKRGSLMSLCRALADCPAKPITERLSEWRGE